MTYTRSHSRPSQKDLGCVIYPLNNKSLNGTMVSSSFVVLKQRLLIVVFVQRKMRVFLLQFCTWGLQHLWNEWPEWGTRSGPVLLSTQKRPAFASTQKRFANIIYLQVVVIKKQHFPWDSLSQKKFYIWLADWLNYLIACSLLHTKCQKSNVCTVRIFFFNPRSKNSTLIGELLSRDFLQLWQNWSFLF